MRRYERPPIEYTRWEAKTHKRIADDLHDGPRTGSLQNASDDLDKVHGMLLSVVEDMIYLVNETRRTVGPGFPDAVTQLEAIRDWTMVTARKVGGTRKAYEDYAEWFENLRVRVEPPKQSDPWTPVTWMHTDAEARDVAAREAAQRAREQMIAHEHASNELARSIPWFASPPGRQPAHRQTQPAIVHSQAADTVPLPRAGFGPAGSPAALVAEPVTQPIVLPQPVRQPRGWAERDQSDKVLGTVFAWEEEIHGIAPPVIGE